MRQSPEGFTLVELVITLALVVLLSAFLSKIQFSEKNARSEIQNALQLLHSVFFKAYQEAILTNSFIYVAIDVSSEYRFRRILQLKEQEDEFKITDEFYLPNDVFIILKDIPQEEVLSTLDYEQEEQNSPVLYRPNNLTISLYGEEIDVVLYTFNAQGKLFDPDQPEFLQCAFLEIDFGQGSKTSTHFPEKNLCGLFITEQGLPVILEDTNKLKEVLCNEDFLY